MVYESGNRIIVNSTGRKGIIISRGSTLLNNYYEAMMFPYDGPGHGGQALFHISDIRLDVEYYRNEKINQIVDGIQ